MILFPVFFAGSGPAAGEIEVVYEAIGTSYGTPLSMPMGIFFDRTRNECYVADSGNHQVVVFDANGLPIFRFYHYVDGGRNGALLAGEPRSLVVNHDGTIFLTDAMAPYIDVLDPRGRIQRRIEVPGDACGLPERFDFLSIGDDQTVYATTACRKPRVSVIADGATVLETIVLNGPDATRRCLTGVAIDANGRICITDACAEHMVQIYGHDGSLVREFGGHDTGFENFSFSAGLAAMNNGDLWIVDSIRQVASRFTQEGKFLAYIGGKGSQPGAFEYPSAVATDGESRVFVLERMGNRYQCFRVSENTGAQGVQE